jgi:G:T/U-mismatch repair DNA glycosylase
MITSSLTSENTKILMLGTIPGNASLEKLEYYGPQKTILENYFFLRKKAFQHF